MGSLANSPVDAEGSTSSNQQKTSSGATGGTATGGNIAGVTGATFNFGTRPAPVDYEKIVVWGLILIGGAIVAKKMFGRKK